jgi:hypothetical protein
MSLLMFEAVMFSAELFMVYLLWWLLTSAHLLHLLANLGIDVKEFGHTSINADGFSL